MITGPSRCGNIADAAIWFIEHGFPPIPIPYGSKAPNHVAWQQMRVSVGDVPRYFDGSPQNIGLLCGEPSHGLTDVDCDVPEAIRAARSFLPPTAMIHGRVGKPRSHYWYRANPVPPQTERYKDTDGTTLIELRSTGGQTVVPPSVHPGGEPLIWEADGEPAAVSAEALDSAVRQIATAALIARHWPHGSRHDTALALAGSLLRHGYTLEHAMHFIRAVCDVAGDEETHARLRDVADTAGRLTANKSATGIPTLNQLLGGTVMEKVVAWLRLDDEKSAQQPTAYADVWTPDVTDTPWPDLLASEAYYGLAGNFVETISPHTEADDAALLIQFLVAFGSMIGRGPHFMAEADKHYTNLFATLVGDSSKGRKGTSFSHVRRTCDWVDGFFVADRIQDGLSSGEGLIYAVRDRVTALVKNKRTGQYEEEIVDEGVEDKRLLIQAPEFASVLQAQGRDGSILSAVLRAAWDKGDLRVLTRKSPLKATDAHISLIGHVTREELRRLFDATDAANGYGNRFLWVAVKRSKFLPEGGRIDEVNFAPLLTKVKAAVAFANTVAEMHRDERARELWYAVYADLSEGKPGLLGAMTSRAEAQVMRLACLYALLDQSATIRHEHLLAALAVWAYCDQSARWIFGDALGDPVADEILRALRAAPSGLTRTEISGLFGRHKNATQMSRALTTLVGRGLARCEREETDGRSAERWFAVRPQS